MNELIIETVSVNDLKFDPTNARKHSERNIKVIANSLRAFGQRKPIVVTRDNIVIAGNGTLEAAIDIGWNEIVIARVPEEWSQEQVIAYALADNRSAELAEWDANVLSEQLLDISALYDIKDFGFQNTGQEVDPYAEWTDMPEFEQKDKLSAFHTTIHFATESDADEFFALINRPKKSSMWFPNDDGHVGSSVKKQYITEEE